MTTLLKILILLCPYSSVSTCVSLQQGQHKVMKIILTMILLHISLVINAESHISERWKFFTGHMK